MLNKKFKILAILFLIAIDKSSLGASTQTEIMTLIKIIKPIEITVQQPQPITMTVSGNTTLYSAAAGEQLKAKFYLPSGIVTAGHQQDWAIQKFLGNITVAFNRGNAGKFDLDLPTADPTSRIEGRAFFATPVTGKDHYAELQTAYVNSSDTTGYEASAYFDVVFNKAEGTVKLKKGQYKGTVRLEAEYGVGGVLDDL